MKRNLNSRSSLARFTRSCALPLGLASAASAQDITPASPSQFDPPPAVHKLETADADLTPRGVAPLVSALDTPLSWGPVRLRPHLSSITTYGDGLRSGPGRSVTTWTESLAPGVLFELGSHWRLDYTPTLTFYTADEYKDTLAHNVLLSGGTSYKDWTFGLTQGYSISSDPLIETARQTEQEIFTTSINAGYRFNSKLMLDLGLNQNFRSAEALNSSRSWSTMNWLNYQVAPRMALGAGAGFGYDDVSLGSDMMHEQLQGRIMTRIAQKLNLNVNGGVEIRQFLSSGKDDLVNPLYGASITYRPFDYTTLTLSGNRRISPSLFQDQVTESTDISLALNQRLLGMFFATLSGGFRNTEYVGSSNSLVTDRSDDSTNFQASLSYAFWKRASASVFYRYTENSSSVPGFEYDSNQVGLTLAYRF
jgi:hypothetical protein